jgi:hypothetical protein
VVCLSVPHGGVTERLGSGLQSREHGFDSRLRFEGETESSRVVPCRRGAFNQRTLTRLIWAVSLTGKTGASKTPRCEFESCTACS